MPGLGQEEETPDGSRDAKGNVEEFNAAAQVAVALVLHEGVYEGHKYGHPEADDTGTLFEHDGGDEVVFDDSQPTFQAAQSGNT